MPSTHSGITGKWREIAHILVSNQRNGDAFADAAQIRRATRGDELSANWMWGGVPITEDFDRALGASKLRWRGRQCARVARANHAHHLDDRRPLSDLTLMIGWDRGCRRA